MNDRQELLNRYREKVEGMAKRKKRLGLVVELVACDYGCGGLAYYRFVNRKVCCSREAMYCLGVRNRIAATLTKIEKLPCLYCGKMTIRPKYCSHKCRSAYAREEREKRKNPCPICGKPTLYKTCSKECSAEAQRGVKKKPGGGKRKGRVELVLDPDAKCKWCGEQAYYRANNGSYLCESNHTRCLGLKKRFVENRDRYTEEFGNPSSDPEIHAKQMAYWTEEKRKDQSERFMGVKCPAKGIKNIGRKPWIDGLTKETDERVARMAEACKGREPWNKNKTMKDDSRIISMAGRGGVRSANSGSFTAEEMNKKYEDLKERELQSIRMKKVYAENPWMSERHSKIMKKVFQERPELREVISKNSTDAFLEGRGAKPKHYKRGYFFSAKNNRKLLYRSSYELTAYRILEQLTKVKSYENEPFAIPYYSDGLTRRTIPDILITYTDGSKELIEVKRENVLQENKVQMKLQAMKEYASDKGWDFSVWTEKELGLKIRR